MLFLAREPTMGSLIERKFLITILFQPNTRKTFSPTHPCQPSWEPRLPCFQATSRQAYPLTIMVSEMEPQLSIPVANKEASPNTQWQWRLCGQPGLLPLPESSKMLLLIEKMLKQAWWRVMGFTSAAEIRLLLPLCPQRVSEENLGRNH